MYFPRINLGHFGAARCFACHSALTGPAVVVFFYQYHILAFLGKYSAHFPQRLLGVVDGLALGILDDAGSLWIKQSQTINFRKPFGRIVGAYYASIMG